MSQKQCGNCEYYWPYKEAIAKGTCTKFIIGENAPDVPISGYCANFKEIGYAS